MEWIGLLFSILLLTLCRGQLSQNLPPMFIPGGDMERFSLSEDTPVGSSVYTLKGKDPEGTDVTYSISGDYLSVDRQTGLVTLVKKLDREKIDSIEVIITVTDSRIFGIDPNTVPIRRDIVIEDVNDNSPTFVGDPYSFYVKESVSPGATLLSDIVITDLDSGINSQISLECVRDETADACELFDIREARIGEGRYLGVISLGSPLDYEKKNRYAIELRATDGGGLMATTTVQVVVEDVQDQAPVLLNAPYSASVKEGTSAGTVILPIIARDGDLGHPQPLRLSIQGDDSRYFGLSDVVTEDDGKITAQLVTSSNPLDREDPIIVQNGGIYTFYIRAEEEGGRRESMRSKVVIVVTDEDDQQPYFNVPSASVSVPENIADGTPLPGLDLVVTDEDLGPNSEFELALEDVHNSAGVFRVFPSKAVGRTPVLIKVLDGSRMDFENPSANRFSFKVVAIQKSRPIASALVNVTVSDANDNPPVFAYPSYRFSVEEGSPPDTVVATLQANDSDSEAFGKLSYSIRGFGAEKFSVSPDNGTIFVESCALQTSCLDYERQSIYSLTYSATDGGGRETSVNVFIDVLDKNDNAPKFDSVEYRRTVDEGTEYFDPPLYIKATDIDGKEQGGGKVTYIIRDGNTKDGAFSINRTSGEVIIKRALTHMDTPSSIYTLVIRASDEGTPPQYSDVRLYITVGRDQNRPPRFTKQVYEATIPENAMPGERVIQVRARDPDGTDEKVTYRMGSGGGDHFTLDETSGLITVSRGRDLDREVQETYNLVIVAIDGGQETRQSSTTTVKVTLADINNKPPAFNKKSYIGHLNERASIGQKVLTVTASDLDQNAKLHYQIVEPIFAYDKTGVTLKETSNFDFKNAFKINESTGDIIVAERLNHDAASVIVLTILVTDTMADEQYKYQNDTTEVTLYIQVFSAKNPIFPPPWTPTNPIVEIELDEEEPLNEHLFSVAAKDPVSGHLVRRYEKIPDSDPENIFQVDPLTGQVSLNYKLDYERLETKMVSFDLLAIAGDRTSKATVNVILKDINDNNPQFSENSYHTRLEEDARWPKLVLKVHAVDADSGENGKVSYSLGGEDKLLFIINETNGEIRVARGAQLDRESTPTVNLEVTAYDMPNGGIMQRQTNVVVKIELIDVNDEVPSWSNNGKYSAVIAENTPVGTPVTTVHATDPDLGVNGVVSYQIPELQGDVEGLFQIDQETGMITVSAPLNGKGRTNPYDLVVRAVDHGSPQQFSQSVVTLFIGDVSINDGVPIFVRPKPNEVAYVMENSRKGTAVFQVEAFDADSPDTPNGKIVYSFLESPARNGPFSIDASTGLITVRGPLDRELEPQHSVVVMAQDLGQPSQATSRVLLINVTDADDNDPVFIKIPGKEYVEMSIEEEAAKKTVVGYVTAVDRDEGSNALIDYTITYGNEQALFGISRTADNRGKIYVMGRIDREKMSELILTVGCGKLGQRLPQRMPYNSDNPSLVQVRIKVDDLDDNRPEFDMPTQTTGIRVDAPLQTKVLKVTAVDKDPTAEPIRYSLYNTSISVLKDHQQQPTKIVNGSDIFLLDEVTGVIRTKANLKSYAGDIFTLYIAAQSDPNDRPVLTKITIFVLRDADLLRFVFNQSPSKVRPQISAFKKKVEESLPLPDHINIYDTNYYSSGDGAINYEKTGSCFQIVGRTQEDARKLLDSTQNQRLKKVFSSYFVDGVEPCQPRRLRRTSIAWVEIWVLVVAGVVGLGAFIASCAVCCLYNNYKKRLRKTAHARLIDTPQLMNQTMQHPGSIIMLPPAPPVPSAGGHHPPLSVMNQDY